MDCVVDVGAWECDMGCVGSAWENVLVLVCVVDFGAWEDILGCVGSRELLRGKYDIWEDISGWGDIWMVRGAISGLVGLFWEGVFPGNLVWVWFPPPDISTSFRASSMSLICSSNVSVALCVGVNSGLHWPCTAGLISFWKVDLKFETDVSAFNALVFSMSVGVWSTTTVSVAGGHRGVRVGLF